MKWYKHHTDSLDDPFIQELMDEFSHLGYAVWFGIIEIICKETGKDLTKKVECSPKYLRRKLRTSQTKLREVFEYCRRDGRLLVDFSDKKWEFQIPKIAEIKDNYTKDLQVAGKKPSKHKEVEVEVEVDKEEKIADFNIFWKAYPKKKSKGQAENTWNKIKPTVKLLALMLEGIERAKKSPDWKKENGAYIPHPSTWLNAKGWEDEVEEELIEFKDTGTGAVDMLTKEQINERIPGAYPEV